MSGGRYCQLNTKKGAVSGLGRQLLRTPKVAVQPRSGPGRESRAGWSTARNAEFQPLATVDGCDSSRRAVDGKAAAGRPDGDYRQRGRGGKRRRKREVDVLKWRRGAQG